MRLYVIYYNPSDFPGLYVVRRQFITATGDIFPDGMAFSGPTLESVREKIPEGLYNLGRNKNDDQTIIEIWI